MAQGFPRTDQLLQAARKAAASVIRGIGSPRPRLLLVVIARCLERRRVVDSVAPRTYVRG